MVDLQSYILNESVVIATQENAIARNGFFLTLFISLISLATALLTLIYAQRRVFSPLIKARTLILDLSHSSDHCKDEMNVATKGEFFLYLKQLTDYNVCCNNATLLNFS